MKVKRILSAVILGTVIMGLLPCVYAEGSRYIAADPTWYIWQDSSDTDMSSWDMAKNAASSTTVTTKEVMGMGVFNDTSETLPFEANREITPVYGGKLTLEFEFALDRQMNGTAFRLLDKTKTAFGIVTKNSSLYLEQPNGALEYLTSFSASRAIDTFTYGIKAVIDIDTDTVEEIYVNGKLCAKNKPFANKAEAITSFDMSTTEKAVGNLLMKHVRLYGGYDVYEMFLNGNGLPEDWQKSGSGSAGLRAFNYRYSDRYSLELETSKGAVEYKKQIDKKSGKLTFETQVLLPKKRNGVEISLMNGSQTVFSIYSDTNSFGYINQNGKKTPLYEYIGNLWYHLRAELDLNTHTVDIYLNGKKKCDDAQIPAVSEIDSIVLKADESSETAVFDDIILHTTPEEPEDYVPEPKAVSSEEYAIGMQMCPLWTEGTHEGWDEINASQGRKPLLGYYDEGDPEYTDWAIKYMAEHGIDFMLPCMYTCYALEEAERDPIKDNSFRHGYAIHNGYFNAKYSDQMPFAILWENGGYKVGRATEKDFFENLVPFWIEYYFKDERYFRLNGRPVMSILTPANFFSIFEGNTQNDEKVMAGIEKFKNMCIQAGVGEPIIMISTGSQSMTEADFDRWNRLGLDGFSKYNYSTAGNVEMYRSYLESYREMNKGNTNLEQFPALCMGFNGLPWESSSTGYTASPEEFKGFMQWVKDEYLPTLPKTKLEKQVLIADTWDEFGEGTILCPNEQFGFAHLDAIREVFIGEGEHEDLVPTNEQKQRISNQYNPDREAPYIKEHVLPDISEQEVIHKWDFSENMGAWIVSGVSEIKHENGAANMKLSSLSPAISLNGSKLDLYNVNYIRLTMKTGKNKGGTVTWTTGIDQNVTNRKYRVIPEQGQQNGEFVDYIVPIAQNHQWKGQLENLDIVLGQFYNTDENIKLKSIEFLGTPEDKLGYKLKANNYTVAINTVTDHDGTVLLDLRKAVEEMGGTYGTLIKDNAAIVSLGGHSIVTANEKTAKKGTQNITIAREPVLSGRKLYVTPSVFTKLTGIGMNYDGKTKSFECSVSEENVNDSGRAVLLEITFASEEDISGLSYSSSVAQKNIIDEGLKMTFTGNDPNFTMPEMSINAADIKRIEIGMSSGASSTGQLFFQTAAEGNFNEAKSMKFSVMPSTKTKSYILNCESNAKWRGTVTRFRLDPLAAGASGSWAKVDYIRLLGDVIETAKDSSNKSCVEVTDTAYIWNFNENTKLDGFKPSKHIADMRVENGTLCFRASNTLPTIVTCEAVSINANKYKSLKINLKNETSAELMRVYFYKDDFNEDTREVCYELPISSKDSEQKQYAVNLTSHEQWNGEVMGIKLEFPSAKEQISIDSIRLEVSQ